MTKTQLIARVAFITCLALISWMALSPNPPNPAGLFSLDKLNHLGAFFVLAVLLDYAWLDMTRFSLKCLSLIFFGLAIEYAQSQTGYRYFEWFDVLADALGVSAYWLLRRWCSRYVDPLLMRYIG